MSAARLLVVVALFGCAYPEFAFVPVDANVTVDDATLDGAIDTAEPDASDVEPSTETTDPNDTGAVEDAIASVDADASVDARADADASVDARADADASVDAPPPVVVTLVARGGNWRYLDDGTSPASTNWRGGGGFDDSKWQTGPAQLGFGDGDEKTVIGPPMPAADAGADAEAGAVDAGPFIVTYYFRRYVNVTGAASYDQLIFRVLRDDGAVVYLNGTEVVRTNMPSGTISPSTFASSTVADGAEDTFYTFYVPPTALREGSNLIAVEVHQSNPGSSDISFDLELAARRP